MISDLKKGIFILKYNFISLLTKQVIFRWWWSLLFSLVFQSFLIIKTLVLCWYSYVGEQWINIFDIFDIDFVVVTRRMYLHCTGVTHYRNWAIQVPDWLCFNKRGMLHNRIQVMWVVDTMLCIPHDYETISNSTYFGF